MAFELDGLMAGQVLEPASPGDLQDIVADARTAGHALVPWGGGTDIGTGNQIARPWNAVRSHRLAGIHPGYSPADLVVTAGAGTLMAELQAFLAGHGQRLPLEAPPGATLGGIVAANSAGRLRLSRGTVRDWLVGLQAVAGSGKAIRAGGRVVKNVTGYDFCKLYTGSRGTLGMLTELSFKVEPIPEGASSGIVSCADYVEAEAVRRAAMEAGASWIELVVDGGIAVEIGFEGYPADVEAQTGRVSAALRRECVDPPRWEAGRVGLRAGHGGTLSGPAGTPALPVTLSGPAGTPALPVTLSGPAGTPALPVTLSGPAGTPALPVTLSGPAGTPAPPGTLSGPAGTPALLDRAAENPVLIRIGVLPDRLASLLARGPAGRVWAHLGNGIATIAPPPEEPVIATWRRLAAEAGGWAVLVRGPRGGEDVFGPSRPEWALGHGIKRVLDPDSVWCPGRGPGRL